MGKRRSAERNVLRILVFRCGWHFRFITLEPDITMPPPRPDRTSFVRLRIPPSEEPKANQPDGRHGRVDDQLVGRAGQHQVGGV